MEQIPKKKTKISKYKFEKFWKKQNLLDRIDARTIQFRDFSHPIPKEVKSITICIKFGLNSLTKRLVCGIVVWVEFVDDVSLGDPDSALRIVACDVSEVVSIRIEHLDRGAGVFTVVHMFHKLFSEHGCGIVWNGQTQFREKKNRLQWRIQDFPNERAPTPGDCRKLHEN